MDLEQGSIELIKMAAKMAMNYYGQPIVCTYSGGKDSDVLLQKNCTTISGQNT